MYFHFLNQLISLLPIFNIKSNITNSTWESEDLTSLWDWDVEMKEDLHILPGSPDIRSEFPVCCNLDPGVKTFHCDKVVTRNVISISHQRPTQNSKSDSNSTRKRFYWSVPECPGRNQFIIFDLKSIGIQNHTRFLSNGYFGYNNEFYSPQEYCINGLTGEFVEVKICEDFECSKERPCIQKCCDPDQIYSFSHRKCIKSNSVPYNPIFYNDMSKKSEQEGKSLIRPHFTISFPRSFKYNCQENTTQIFPFGNLFADYLSNSTGRKYFPATFHIRKDGVILYKKDGKALIHDGHPIFVKENTKKCYTLKTEHYCIDGATDYGSPDSFSNEESQTFLVTCSEYLYQPPIIGPLSFVYGNVMIASSFFSLLTVLVYLALKHKRNKIHGLTIISYATSMFFMYVFLGLAHLIRYYGSDEVLKSKPCVIIGIASHLFSLSSFLWLTMMNLDLYWTFRKIRPLSRLDYQLKQTKLWNLYLRYSIFGWGFPVMIVSASSYLHFNYEAAAEEDCADIGLPLPAYGRESCEIKTLSLGVYLYFPASALLLCNLVFFVVTTYKLCKHETTILMTIKRIQERHHQSMQLFGKLFFVMGVTRGFEVISWAHSGPNLTWYWAVFDFFNITQAVAIFIIYVCKRDVVRALKIKLQKLMYRQKDSFRFKNRNEYAGYENATLSKH